MPQAQRQYDALEIRAEGRIGRYSMLASYTYSRLFGNYAGLANSDEAGRMDPSISRSFDFRRTTSTAPEVSEIRKAGWQRIVRTSSSVSVGAIFKTDLG